MIGTIEAAIVERLRSANAIGLLGYRLKTVASYGGEFDSDEDFKKIAAGLPGAWVVFRDEDQIEDRGNGSWLMRPTFSVLVAASNQRNEAARRHGAAGEVGTYQMAADIRTLLANQRLGLEIGYLEPNKTRSFPVARPGGVPVSIVACEFRTTYLAIGAPDASAATLPADLDPALGVIAAMGRAAGLTDFAGIDADWQTPLPAADTLTLETAE